MKFSARVPSDVVMGVLHFMGGGTRFYCNHLMLQRFFYWASTQEEYKDLFKRWIFATDGIVPRSQTLTFGLDRLGLSQLFYSVTLISDDYEVSSYLGGRRFRRSWRSCSHRRK